MCESKYLEYKEKVTNTFLKTVSAFANYGTGKIMFGVKDDGKIVGIKNLTKDILKTLELYSNKEGYNKAGEILADNNSFPGIDIVRFVSNINIILDREIIENKSVLTEYEKALDMFRKYYIYEEIKGSRREKIENIPEKAFREAVINALLHRTWDINAHVRIAMFEDRIEIMSPGSLPKGLTEKEYLDGQVSVLRNPILGNVFFRLHLIERFGTGVKRINEEYSKSRVKPKFDFYDNSIKVTLPVVEFDLGLKDDELRVYKALNNSQMLSSSDIANYAGFGKNKTVIILKKLVEQGYIKVTGSGRGTRYFVERII